MSKVQLTTLTPVHIGSGIVLQNNIDFIQGDVDGYTYLGILDHQKLMQVIGLERIDSWVAAIERGEGMADFLADCSTQELTIEDYSSRLAYCPQPLNMATNEPMREFIHDGFGKAYIPGSSLKGSIRTALLSYLIDKKNLDVSQRINFKNKKFAAQDIESALFGKDPNTDCFRFLQIGDVYFNNECEYVYNMININERERQSFVDRSKHQLVEAVFDEDPSCVFNMRINQSPELSCMIDEHNRRTTEWNSDPRNAGRKKKNLIKKFEVSDLNSLFSIINNHTQHLLEGEVGIWSDFIEEDGVRDYLNFIEEMQVKVAECKRGECVLRVGHASGWRFTTGAWAEDDKKLADDTWYKLVDLARPMNRQKYDGMQFPKSRRVNYQKGHDMTLLGFVKLKIVE